MECSPHVVVLTGPGLGVDFNLGKGRFGGSEFRPRGVGSMA